MSAASRKVFHLINGEFYSGAERVQDLLVQRLPDFGYEAWLACVKPNKFPERAMCDHTRILLFPMKTKLDFLNAIMIGKYVRSQEFSIIHTHTPRTAITGYIASKIADVPLVHHLHSPASCDTDNALRNKVNAYLESFVMKKAHRIIPVSNSLSKHLIKLGVSQQKIDKVWNGVHSLPSLSERDAPHGVWTIGALALFRPRKGLEILLRALALLKNNVPVKFNAIGEFETEHYKEEVLRFATKLGISDIIEWVGFANNVNKALSSVDICVLPSLHGEGMPMVVLEAMTNGVPVVSTNVEGVPEAIPSDDYGCIVEAGDVTQLADAIHKLICSPDHWRRIRANAYERQVKYFSDDAMARNVAHVYNKALQER